MDDPEEPDAEPAPPVLAVRSFSSVPQRERRERKAASLPTQPAETEPAAPAAKRAADSDPDPSSSPSVTLDSVVHPLKRARTDSEEFIRRYYSHMFPYALVWRWLCAGKPDLARFREFAFYQDGLEVPLRFRSFGSPAELRAYIVRISAIRIDIGAVYESQPRLFDARPTASRLPIERELVFDVDLTDYDRVRTCCREKACCNRCWWLAAVAIKVLDAALREDFGFRDILCVFSGRRGIHVWVSDERARKLDDEGRRAIAGYLKLVVSAPDKEDKAWLWGEDKTRQNIHPSLERALTIMQPMARVNAGIVPPVGQGRNQEEAHRQFLVELAIRCYPRLDVKVTTGTTHLLKTVFSVHPGTGKICVPFNASTCEHFNPDTVPTAAQLVTEYNQNAPAHTRSEGSQPASARASPPTSENNSQSGYAQNTTYHHTPEHSSGAGDNEGGGGSSRAGNVDPPTASRNIEYTSLAGYVELFERHILAMETRRGLTTNAAPAASTATAAATDTAGAPTPPPPLAPGAIAPPLLNIRFFDALAATFSHASSLITEVDMLPLY